MNGLITEIQRGSLHDGPGIRTVVFMKGCNLRCAWCHNPETIFPGEEILFSPEKCIGCGQCAKGCFSGAKVRSGKTVSVEEVLSVIIEDRPYYGPEGGVTVSGGEPAMQADFVCELLSRCRENGIGTAVETNLSFPSETVTRICSLCDLVMCDLKTMDSDLHRRYTGAGNERILENMKKVGSLGIPMLVRTPVIRDVNDAESEIDSIAAFLAEIPSLKCYELLTYHPLGLSKPASEHFKPQAFEKPTREQMKKLAAIAASHHIPVRIDNVVFQEVSK